MHGPGPHNRSANAGGWPNRRGCRSQFRDGALDLSGLRPACRVRRADCAGGPSSAASPMDPFSLQVHLQEIGVLPQRSRTSAIRQLVLQARRREGLAYPEKTAARVGHRSRRGPIRPRRPLTVTPGSTSPRNTRHLNMRAHQFRSRICCTPGSTWPCSSRARTCSRPDRLKCASPMSAACDLYGQQILCGTVFQVDSLADGKRLQSEKDPWPRQGGQSVKDTGRGLVGRTQKRLRTGLYGPPRVRCASCAGTARQRRSVPASPAGPTDPRARGTATSCT